MRLFTGISLPPGIVNKLTTLIEHLRPHAHVKWSPAYNLHITTKFIGEWPEDRLEELKSVLAEIPRRPPIPISIAGIGWFPNPHSPRILWAAVRAPESLTELASATDAALSKLEVPPETREFSPHLTLARIKDPVPLAALRNAIADLKSQDFGSFTATHFHLYLSRPGPAASIYTQLADFPIT